MAAGEPRLHRLLRHLLRIQFHSGFNWDDDGCLILEVAFFNCQPCSKCGRTFLPLAGPTRTLERGPADYIRRGVGEFRLMGGVQNERSRLTCRMAFECLELSPREQGKPVCYEPQVNQTHPRSSTFKDHIYWLNCPGFGQA